MFEVQIPVSTHAKQTNSDSSPPVVPFYYRFLGEGSPAKIDYGKKSGTLILTSQVWRTKNDWISVPPPPPPPLPHLRGLHAQSALA